MFFSNVVNRTEIPTQAILEGITPRQKLRLSPRGAIRRHATSHRSTVDAAAAESDDYARAWKQSHATPGRDTPNATLEGRNQMLPASARAGLL